MKLKTTLLLLLILISFFGVLFAQGFKLYNGYGLSVEFEMPYYSEVITDSVVWRTTETDSLNLGDGKGDISKATICRRIISCILTDFTKDGLTTCYHGKKWIHAHDWVYSEEWGAREGLGCLVNHNGLHCDWTDKMRHRICRKCLRKETQREYWYQHRDEPPEPPKTEYEQLEERLNK